MPDPKNSVSPAPQLTLEEARQRVISREDDVPDYTLPDPLIANNGTPITTAAEWMNRRRSEILDIFTSQMFGRAPSRPADLSFSVYSQDNAALNGKAIQKQIDIRVSNRPDAPVLRMLIYLPISETPVPMFMGLNFRGNHTVDADPSIAMAHSWVPNDKPGMSINHQPTQQSRGKFASSWPVELILSRGYGLATIYMGDIDPDFDDGFQNGVHPLFYKPGQSRPAADEWGSIAAWAWGLSRGMDYLEQDPQIDAKRVSVVGHSRLGKTALWAGATDPRFALIVSNNSGCGGAAIARRKFGETHFLINQVFPHWFCQNFKQYDNREDTFPVDQHQLIALQAPRPVYIASATEDLWADPRGEYLSGFHAGSVYELFGYKGLIQREPPEPDLPVGDRIRYHIRRGEHAITAWDWSQYLDFSDQHLQR